jgi:hypothetical protein
MHVMNMQESQIKISIRLRKSTNTTYSKSEIYTKGGKIPNSELNPQIPNTNKFHFFRQIKPKKPNKQLILIEHVVKHQIQQ